MTSKIFPDVPIIMVEAQNDKRVFLEKVSKEIGSHCSYHLSLLGPEEKQDVPFFKMETGSSVLEENTSHARTKTTLNMTTLDNLYSKHNFQGALFLKLDTQGFEIEVLKGASNTLAQTEFVLLELSTLNYNKGAPLFQEVSQFLYDKDFLLYDLVDITRKETDHTLMQFDAIFIKKSSLFREKVNSFN